MNSDTLPVPELKWSGIDHISFINNYVHDCGAVGLDLSMYGIIDVSQNLFKRISAKHIGLCNFDHRMTAAISIQDPRNSNTSIQFNYFDSVGIALQSHTFGVGESSDISYNYVENYGISASDLVPFILHPI